MCVLSCSLGLFHRFIFSYQCAFGIVIVIKAMDDIGVVMTPFGDVVTVILVANSYVVGFFSLKSGVVEVY